MRFLMMYRPDPALMTRTAPDPEHMATMNRFIEEGLRDGSLIDTGALLKNVTGARVRSGGHGEFIVSEGHSPDNAVDPVVGYAIVQAASKAEVIENAKRFLRVAGAGESQIFQIMEAPPET